VAALPGDVKQSTAAVILRLEQPSGIVKRLPPESEENLLD